MPKSKKKSWSQNSKRGSAIRRRERDNHQVQKVEPTHHNVDAFHYSHKFLIAVAKKALTACLETHHPECPAHPFDATGFLPTRLLDLEILERPKLILSADIKEDQDRRYICLSHQWGDPDLETRSAMTTTKGNLQSRLGGVDLWTLPKRYREAAMTCRLIGVRYIWIDFLCILQDDPDDWKIQSTMMARVYECGLLTISSNISVNDQKWRPPNPHEWIPKFADEDRHASWLSAMLLNGPLGKRAWCLQERYLSPRILHIFEGDVWIWECDSRVRAAGRKGMFFRHDISDPKEECRKVLIRKGQDRLELLDIWDKAVSDYSGRVLTYESDKLPAISGVASKLKSLLGCGYVAGHWEDDLFGLMWHCPTSPSTELFTYFLQTLPPTFQTRVSSQAPSWSWASVEQPVKYLSFRKTIPSGQGTTSIQHKMDRKNIVPLASFTKFTSGVEDECSLGRGMSSPKLTLSGHMMSRKSWPKYYHRYGCVPKKDQNPNTCAFIIGMLVNTSDKLFGLFLRQSELEDGTWTRVGIFDEYVGGDQSVRIRKKNRSWESNVSAIDIPLLVSLLGPKTEVTII